MRVLIEHVAADIERGKGQREQAPSIGVLFGTHNWDSCRLILDELSRRRLGTVGMNGDGEECLRLGGEVTRRVTLGKIYGESEGGDEENR